VDKEISRSGNADPAVLFFAFGEVGSTVYRSQVVSVVARLSERLPARLVQLLSFRRYFDPAMKKVLAEEWDGMRGVLGDPPIAVSVLPNRLDPALSGPLVLRALRSSIPPSPVIAHCRGSWAAAAGLAVKKRWPGMKVLFDARGARVEEIQMTGQAARYARLARRLEGRACLESDAIVCVTGRLADYLAESYGADPARMTVTPAGFDETRFGFDSEARESRRRALGVGNRPVFVFCGGWDPWQAVPLNAGLLRAICDIEPDAFVLGLSQDADRIDRIFEAEGIESGSRRVLRVPFEQVPSYLCAADAAVVLREPSVVNRVASPVKFAEYQGCGLPAAVSEDLGDAARIVTDAGSGVVYRGDLARTARDLVELARADRDDPSRRAARAGRAAGRLSVGANIDVLERLYRSLSTA